MDDRFTQTLDANDSVLLLIDYQAKMLDGVELSDRTSFKTTCLPLPRVPRY